jgi:hypothetical protein
VPAAPIIEPSTVDDGNTNKVEIVIPLVSDSAFFELLVTALQGLSAHLLAIHAQFVETLAELTRSVSDSARPVSSTSHSFKAHSPWNSDAGGVRVDASSRKVRCFFLASKGRTCVMLNEAYLFRVTCTRGVRYSSSMLKPRCSRA